jgi:DNA-binding response OmpR family regulator
MRLLLIEDSGPTRELLQHSLESQSHVVQAASTAADGRQRALRGGFDVVILDIQLPDGDGVSLCRELRSEGVTAPVLFLTARGDVGDRIAGLDAGGDDYMKKPFALAELHARLRALSRRTTAGPPAAIEGGGLSINFTARKFERRGHEIPLTGREWRILEILASRKACVVSRDEVMEGAWGKVDRAASESLDVIVSRLRRKLDSDTDGWRIRTVRGEGYVFELQP